MVSCGAGQVGGALHRVPWSWPLPPTPNPSVLHEQVFRSPSRLLTLLTPDSAIPFGVLLLRVDKEKGGTQLGPGHVDLGPALSWMSFLVISGLAGLTPPAELCTPDLTGHALVLAFLGSSVSSY